MAGMGRKAGLPLWGQRPRKPAIEPASHMHRSFASAEPSVFRRPLVDAKLVSFASAVVLVFPIA